MCESGVCFNFEKNWVEFGFELILVYFLYVYNRQS